MIDIGITFEENLNWYSHISNITKSAQKAGWVLSVFKDRSPFVMLTLYKSLVRSHLEYGCSLWIGLNQHSICQLESVQRHFTNKIDCPSHVSNYWQRLEHLHLMSLQRRRQRYVFLHMWNIFHELTNNDLNITFYSGHRLGFLANIPPLMNDRIWKPKSSNFVWQFVFSKRTAAVVWNLIPREVKEKDTLIAFKAKLDNYLNDIPDRPPVFGYSQQNNNSLLDWHSVRLL